LDVSGHSGLPPEVHQWEVEIRRPIWAKVSKTFISTNKAGMCACNPSYMESPGRRTGSETGPKQKHKIPTEK
jgi:hypothetical protein